jgi:starch synthase
MNIVFVASEVTPFAKTGGLADVAGALPRSLHRLGHDVRVFTPFYSSIAKDRYAITPVASVQRVPLRIGTYDYEFSLFSALLPDSTLPIFLIDCPELYARGSIYTSHLDEQRRFLLLQRGTLECCQRMQFAPDILHCNDWHTGLMPLMVKTSYAWDRLFHGTRSVMSIHNIGYQGQFGLSTLAETGIANAVTYVPADDLARGDINWLREGVTHADAVCTVSPTYAQEICTPAGGFGLEPTLLARPDPPVGILNGVDYDSWNPATDTYLPAHYDPAHLDGKRRCKQALLTQGKLPVSIDTPVIGLVSRLAIQKGIDLLFDSLPELLTARDFSLCVLGSGDAKYVAFFDELATRFPDRVYFVNGYSESLAHLIEAGSDMFLMPSLYEPCGLNQLYSLKYGTVPIVRRTGGLADSVQMWDGVNGTGIVFNDFDVPAVRWALHAALDLFKDQRAWARMMQNGMAQDFSWDRQAQAYEELYRKIGLRAEG